MLDRFTRWHVAKKLFRPWGERRFCWITANDDDNGELEQESKTPSSQEGLQNFGALDQIASETKINIEHIRPAIASEIVNSPFSIEVGLQILQERLRKTNDPNLQSIVQKGNRIVEMYDKGEPDAILTKEVSEDLAEMLQNPDVAIAFSQSLEQRLLQYRELKRITGNAPLRKLVELDQSLMLEEGDRRMSMLSNPERWTDEEVDALFIEAGMEIPELGDLQPKEMDMEQRRAFLAARNAHGLGAPRDLTKEEKLEILHTRLMSARKMAHREQVDLGTESTLDDTDELESRFFNKLLLSRRNLVDTLKVLSGQRTNEWKELAKELEQQAGTADPLQIASHLGISAEAFGRRMSEIGAILSSCANLSENPEENVHEKQNILELQKHLSQLNDLDWLGEGTLEERITELIGKEKVGLHKSQEWMQTRSAKLEEVYDVLQNDPKRLSQIATLLNFDDEADIEVQLKGLQKHIEVAKRIQNGKATKEDRQHLYDEVDTNKQRKLDMLILALESPSFLTLLRRDMHAMEKDNNENTPEVRDALFEELDSAIERLENHTLLQHETCAVLAIPWQLRNFGNQINGKLKQLGRMQPPKVQQVLRECTLGVQKLTKTAKELDGLQISGGKGARVRRIPVEHIEQYEKVAGTKNTAGCYEQTSGVIYINESRIRNTEHEEAVLHHEQGHAVIDMLKNHIGVLPMLFFATNECLAQKIPGDTTGKTFDALLWERADDYHITRLREPILQQERRKNSEEVAQKRTKARMKELLMDELVNKYASWKHSGEDPSGFTHEDRMLFSLLDGKYEGSQTSINTEDLSSPENIALQHDELLDAHVSESNDHQTDTPIENSSLIGTKIMEMQNKLLRINAFIKTHKGVDGIEEFSNWVKLWEQFFEEKIKNPYYKPTEGTSVPESELTRLVEGMGSNFIENAENQIKNVSRQDIDAIDNAEGAKGLMTSLRSLRFASFNDVIGTFKAMGEDLQRMWKRRSEATQARLGQNLTGWIGNNVPFFGQLKHEFNRRDNASELEEVNQWKEALKELDSYELMDSLAQSRNKDQVRALIELLVERGRLDMNDERFWKTLKDLSGQPMDMEACKNNSILRDKWLQSMITEIWDDKDKYYEWRQSNDSGISSGKEKFQQVADQLSNVSGGLAAELERQLTLWVESKRNNQPVPDEVNPHLYEKILHYSMSNGKMSMEDKMFYLVQGARHRLISIDRIQALAGENGGVLNAFPMIDYFTAGNNTLPEYKAIGSRIEESGSPFKPGQKTSLWIHTEVLHDEDARQRMSKAMSGERLQGVDHEDWPTIAAMMDYKNMEEITGLLSGGRFKISYEAVKNIYTGTSKKLLILARKAQLAEEGDAMFTTEDAADAARTIMAHIHFDNIVTLNAKDGNTVRINMTLDQLNSQQGPSTGGLVVSKFRDPLQDLARDALQGANVQFGSGQLKNTSIDTYLRSEDEERNNKIILDSERRQDNFNATGEIEKQLRSAFIRNPKLAQQILLKYADKLKSEHNIGIELDSVRKYLHQARNHEKIRSVSPRQQGSGSLGQPSLAVGA